MRDGELGFSDLRYLKSWLKGLLAAIVVASVGLAAIAVSAHQDVAHWKERSQELTKNIKIADARNDQLSRELNSKVRLINISAAKLSRSQNDLLASEQDVKSLAERQRQLAHEKAAIEDQRAELIRSAAILSTALDTGQDCQTGLYKLISALAEEDYLYLQGSADRIFDTCEEAERQFQIAQKAIGG